MSLTASPFPPIADYAFLSDCHTGALVAPDGSVDWLCVPAFDSPTSFGNLLDRGAGSFRFGPYGINVPTAPHLRARHQRADHHVAHRRRLDPGARRPDDGATTGAGHDHPAHPAAGRRRRRAPAGAHGRVPRRDPSRSNCVCEPAFDYGRDTRRVDAGRTTTGHAADATGAGQTFRLSTDLSIGIEGGTARARHVLTKGETAFCALSWADELASPTDVADAAARIDATVRFWRDWLARARIPDHPLRHPLERSALTIKGLTYMPTGATVAALTTSLPETPGGERNWDYRYTWMRDTHLHPPGTALPEPGLGGRRVHAVRRRSRAQPRTAACRSCTASTAAATSPSPPATTCPATRARSPVRIGNGAFDQRQNDVFGAVLDSILLHTRRSQHLPRRLWPLVQSQAEGAIAVWREPDQGIWEARGKPQHYVSSKLMGWVALDRAAKLAAIRGDDDSSKAWAADRRGDQADILAHGVSDRGVLRQHYDTDALDASHAARPAVRLPARHRRADEEHRRRDLRGADRERVRAALRHRRDRRRPVRQGGHLPDLLVLAGVRARHRRRDAARRPTCMERLLRISSPLGLYAEEFEVDRARHLGNFPQAFSHLALIEAAGRIILADRLEELSL